jgi:hypothetical protein
MRPDPCSSPWPCHSRAERRSNPTREREHQQTQSTQPRQWSAPATPRAASTRRMAGCACPCTYIDGCTEASLGADLTIRLRCTILRTEEQAQQTQIQTGTHKRTTPAHTHATHTMQDPADSEREHYSGRVTRHANALMCILTSYVPLHPAVALVVASASSSNRPKATAPQRAHCSPPVARRAGSPAGRAPRRSCASIALSATIVCIPLCCSVRSRNSAAQRTAAHRHTEQNKHAAAWGPNVENHVPTATELRQKNCDWKRIEDNYLSMNM